MDPISLGLGIAPLCLSAVKAGSAARKKIKILRSHDREARRLRTRLETQASIFIDECHLLLQEVVDSSLVQEMLGDFAHEQWRSAELDEKLRAYLGRKHDEVQDAINEIKDQIQTIEEELDSVEDNHANSGKLTIAAHTAMNAVAMIKIKPRLDKEIETLAELVHDLRRLRKTAKAIQKPRSTHRPQKQAMPTVYRLVARHSAAFHEAFIKSWSCLNENGTHSRHVARLLLDTEASSERVDFRLVLGYEVQSGVLGQQSLLFLRVRSIDRTWTNYAPTAEETGRLTKERKVRFADAAPFLPSTDTPASLPAQSKQHNEQNLCKTKDICQHIFKHGKATCQSSQEACIGYLDSTMSCGNLRHRFLTAQDRESIMIQTTSCTAVTLESIIQPSKKYDVSIIDQLQLALRLARSVLQYHSTPWWHRNWSLSDLSYFDIDTSLTVSLKTLHVDTMLLPANDTMAMQNLLAQVPRHDEDNDDDGRLLCGIRNTTLYSLGAALVQIERWECLDATDVLLIRKVAERASPLGARYRELTKKCLYCDFGFGDDLERLQLQTAVYENVVCELEQIVGLFEDPAVPHPKSLENYRPMALE